MPPIDRLVARLTASPMWNNGGFPKIELPDTASDAQIVAAAFERISFDGGKVTKHAIAGTKTVRIGQDTNDYKALLVDTNVGRKIVLVRYEGLAVGWWSRIFAEEAP